MENYAVTTADNGRAGLDAIEQAIPDLVLCDVMVPEVDGYRVLQSVREDRRTASLPFVFLTAKGEQVDQRAGIRRPPPPATARRTPRSGPTPPRAPRAGCRR